MTEPKTQASLLSALIRASRRGPTQDEARKQRVSFIISCIKDQTKITRAQIEHVLNVQEGRKAS